VSCTWYLATPNEGNQCDYVGIDGASRHLDGASARRLIDAIDAVAKVPSDAAMGRGGFANDVDVSCAEHRILSGRATKFTYECRVEDSEKRE
jgi:hypothetical protein